MNEKISHIVAPVSVSGCRRGDQPVRNQGAIPTVGLGIQAPPAARAEAAGNRRADGSPVADTFQRRDAQGAYRPGALAAAPAVDS